MQNQKPVNLLIVNTLYTPHKRGGAEVSVQRVAEYLVTKGFSVSVLTLSPSEFSESCINGVNVIRWPIDNHYSVFNYDDKQPGFLSKLIWQLKDLFNFRVYFRLQKLLKSKAFDVVWTNNLSGFSVSVWAACKRLKIPVAHTCRDYYLLSNNVQLYSESKGFLAPNGPIPKLKQQLLRHHAEGLYGFVGISNAILSTHITYAPKINHIGKTFFNSVNAPREWNTAEVFKKNRKVFGFMGQVTESKGVIELLKSVSNANHGAILLIAGNASEELKKQYNHPNIVFLGHVKPEDFYSKIDGLLVPSKWQEPFGRVVIEAITHKTPVLCSNNGGLAELASLFKSVQIYDFTKSTETWESAISDFHTSDLDVVLSTFSDETIGDAYARLLANAANSKQ